MNESFFIKFLCDEELKQNTERYTEMVKAVRLEFSGDRESERGSMVGRICGAGQYFKSGMEERGSDGWCDGGDGDMQPVIIISACYSHKMSSNDHLSC